MMPVQLDAMLEQNPETCGGRLRIAGTRITVHQIAALHEQGLSVESIVEDCPYLIAAQVYAALAHYHANRAEVLAELAAANAEYERLKSQHAPPSQP